MTFSITTISSNFNQHDNTPTLNDLRTTSSATGCSNIGVFIGALT
ncbi:MULTISPECIES: hypothetical protein [unclassified Bartonella]